MAENPTVRELIKAKAILPDEIDAAVDAVLAKPNVSAYPIGSGYLLDLAAAVRAHPFSNATISGGEATPSRKRKAIRTALLAARPVKGCGRNAGATENRRGSARNSPRDP